MTIEQIRDKYELSQKKGNFDKHKIHFTICSTWDHGFAYEIKWLGANSISTMYRIARQIKNHYNVDGNERDGQNDFMNFGNDETYVKWEYNRRFK